MAVLIQPEPNPGTATVQTIAGGTGGNGGVTTTDGPTFIDTIGWDWLPTIHDRDTGIWQEVTISSSGPATIQNPYVTSQLPLPSTASAALTIQATVSNATAVAQTGTLTGIIDGTNTFQQAVSIPASGTQTVTFNTSNTPSLNISNPTLWWPNGYGSQNLHTLQLSLSIGGGVSDSQTISFGIRQITYSQPGSSNLSVSVNGVPVICKGGDWGMDEALKRIPAGLLDTQVHLHQLANYTIIRNWVGQSTSEDFYNACDKYGILVWDEFFQPYPNSPDPTNVPLYLANVQDKILRFRNHPSIAIWCGRNEGNPSPAAVASGIVNLLSTLDPGRFYQANSNSGGGVVSGGPYYWQPPRNFYSYSDTFKTEVGSVSIPTLESVEGMMPSSAWQVVNNDWAEHDLCSGAQAGDQYLNIIPSRYGPVSSLADFVRKAQLANYEDFRAMYEGRFAKLFNPVEGVITWMSNPAHPSFVWQLYGWDLEPNASLFGAKKACEPVHIELNQSNWHAMVVNSTPQTLSGLTATTTVYNLDGSLQYTQTNALTANASAATDLGGVNFPSSGLSPVHFVKLRLTNSQNQLLSDNFYWRETVTDNFQALDTLPMVTLNVQATQQTSGSNTILNATLTNPSGNIAVMSHLQLREAASGQRVTPVYYSDNYISLLPGESRSVTVTAATADFDGQAPMLAVDGWNVTVNPSAASGNLIAITNNPAAAAHSGVNASTVSTYKINCGGGPSAYFQFGPPYTYDGYTGFIEDSYASGGSTDSTTNAINTNAPNAAPAMVYRTERYGTFTYTIPVTSGPTFTVRLHFAETLWTSAGAREFNVAINGQQVLTNFDIYAAGGANTAVVRDFPGVLPDSNSNITISFTPGLADNPKIDGIEILPSGLVNMALNQPTTASSTSGNYAAANATDGNAGTRWSSNFTDNEWIYVDLGSVVPITGVELMWETAYASSFNIQVSNDATNWTTVYSTTSGTGGTQQINFSATGRYVKMLGIKRATQWGYSLYEFQVYGNGYLPQTGGIYQLICKTSGMALDNGGSIGNGTDVTQYTKQTGNINQQWKVVDAGGGYYNLICQKSNAALDNGGKTNAGAIVTQWAPLAGNTNQEWQFVYVGAGEYNLICLTSGMALDNAGSTSSRTNVTQWTQLSGNTNQEWFFEPIQ